MPYMQHCIVTVCIYGGIVTAVSNCGILQSYLKAVFAGVLDCQPSGVLDCQPSVLHQVRFQIWQLCVGSSPISLCPVLNVCRAIDLNNLSFYLIKFSSWVKVHGWTFKLVSYCSLYYITYVLVMWLVLMVWQKSRWVDKDFVGDMISWQGRTKTLEESWYLGKAGHTGPCPATVSQLLTFSPCYQFTWHPRGHISRGDKSFPVNSISCQGQFHGASKPTFCSVFYQPQVRCLVL